MRDTIAHGTSTKGSKHPSAKLTEKDVLEIRSLRGIKTTVELAKKFGVGHDQISRIQTGKRWGSVGRA